MHSQLDRHHTEDCLAEDTFVDDARGRVLETKSQASETRGKTVVSLHRRFGNPSLARTWMQKEPTQCLCAGLTLTRPMRTDQITGVHWSCESRCPFCSCTYSGIQPLESESIPRSVAKGKRTLAIYDISRAHFRGVPARRVFVDLPREEREARTRERTGSGIRWLAVLVRACLAQSTPVLVGELTTRRSLKITIPSKAQQSCTVCAIGTRCSTVRSR